MQKKIMMYYLNGKGLLKKKFLYYRIFLSNVG